MGPEKHIWKLEQSSLSIAQLAYAVKSWLTLVSRPVPEGPSGTLAGVCSDEVPTQPYSTSAVVVQVILFWD